MYKLHEGRFKDQFGKHSKQQLKTEKDRHVPPFPFKDLCKFGSANQVALKDGDNNSISIFSSKTQQKLLQIKKKGDYGIQAFDFGFNFLVYSDCVDTQVFHIEDLTITKMTKKICITNEVPKLPPV